MVRRILPATLPAILVAALAVAPAQAQARTMPEAAAITSCSGGTAGGYPCNNVDLWSNLPLSGMGGGSGSGGWGWHDAANNREYAVVARTNGTAFVDVTVPDSPRYLGNLPSATGTSSWRELWVHNNTAYIVSDSNGSHGMQIFDLTRLRNVTNPPVTFTADARNTSFTSAHTININPSTGNIFVNGSNTCSGGLRMFNTANRLNPTFLGCASADGYTHDSQAVTYNGLDAAHRGKEIVVASNADTLTVWDVQNKSAPVMLARKTYSGRGYTHQGWFTENHRYFLLDDETDETSFGHNTKTYVWDMADLDNPVLIGTKLGPTQATDHNQYVKGNYVYQSNYRAGLRILNLTNVANPSALTEDAYFDVEPASNARGYAGTWTNYPYLPSGNVLIFSIQRGLFVVRPNLTTPPPGTTIFSDNFETNLGWTTNPNGTDTATTGLWERGDPESTSSSGVSLQLGTTTSGTNDLVTGRLAGSGAGSYDVDGGVTSSRSPAITLSGTGTFTLAYSWYLAHLNNSSSADFFRVSIVHNGGTTVLFTQAGAATNRAGSWATGSSNISAYAGQSVRILVQCADAATASLVECGLDDVRITRQ